MLPASILLCLLVYLGGCRALSQGISRNSVDRAYNATNMVTACPPNIVFVLDGSDSVSPNGFKLARYALLREIKRVYNAFAYTDVGVIMFSDTTFENSVLKIQTRSRDELQTLLNEVKSLSQPRKKTAMPVALRHARQVLAEYSNSIGRMAYDDEKSGNLIVLITDGVPGNTRDTIQEAKLARDNGIIIISMSIEHANQGLLRDISNVVQDYRTPIDWKGSISCPVRVLEPVTPSRCFNLLLVIDGSDSVLRYKETVRQYLVFTALRYRKIKNRIGVLLYGTDEGAQRRNTMLHPTENKHTLAEDIRQKLVFPKSGGTGTDVAVNQAVTLLNDEFDIKPATLVLITDGPPLDPGAMREAIRNARNNDYQVIIIRVGKALTDDLLTSIAGNDNSVSVYSVEDFTELFGLDFDDRVCPVCPLSCPIGSVQNPNTCLCRCTDSNKILRGNSCVCTQGCPFDSVQNPITCACTCRDQNKILRGNSCVCPPRNCPFGSVQNPNTCLCRCTHSNKTLRGSSCVCTQGCPFDSVQNPNTCACTCRDQNKILRGNSCVCPLSCPIGSVQNPNTCLCRCTDSNKILRGNSCVCPEGCPFDRLQNPNTCECRCRYPYSFLIAYFCVCPDGCPFDMVQDPNDCTCRCMHPKKKRIGNSCACEPRDCLNSVQDINTCECQCADPSEMPNGNCADCDGTRIRCSHSSPRFNQALCRCEM